MTRIVGVICLAAGLFFTYYTTRLAWVWHTRVGERPAGMYIGAVVFPVLAIGFGLGAYRFLRPRRPPPALRPPPSP